MSIKKIKKHNDDSFIKDIKRCRDVLTYLPETACYVSLKKGEIRKEAELCKIRYYISDKIYVVKRDTMIIL